MSHASSTPDPEQLALFDPAPRKRPHARRGGRRVTRTLLTLLALGAATAGVMAGSFAAWTAQSANPGNQVKAGTLTMTNSRSAAYVFSATNVVPGDTGSGTVTVANTGSIPMAVKLTQDQVSSTGIEASLGLKVHDDTRNWCYWPVAQSGACPATYGAWSATGTLSSLQLPATSGAATWPAGQSHAFTISWTLLATSPNSDQGKTGSFRLVWDGTQ
jgi:hypothetical protein